MIDAYATSARVTIEKAEIVKKQPMEAFKLRLPYSLYDTVKHELEIIGGTLENPEFETDIICKINVPKEKAKMFAEELCAKGAEIITNE